MPTVQEIINYADKKYSNSILLDDKVIDLNDIHTKVYVKIQKLKNDIEIYEFQLVPGLVTYELPDNCSIDSIITDGVKVSGDQEITTNTEFITYKYAGLNDSMDCGCYYFQASKNLIGLYPYPTEKDGGKSVRILFYKKPAKLLSSNLDAVPDLAEEYHGVLKSKLIQMLASTGHNPDPAIANYWQKEYEEQMKDIEDDLSQKIRDTELKVPAVQNVYSGWW